MAKEIVNEVFVSKVRWRKWKEKAPETPCDILVDSIDEPIIGMFEAVRSFDIGLDKYDISLMRGAILDIEKEKALSEKIWKKAGTFLLDLDHIKELMDGVLLEQLTGEEVDAAAMELDAAWKIPLWRLYHECRKLYGD